MKKNIGVTSRILLAICGLALAAVLFVPVWRIDLVAPQYPEGLFLLIYPHKLAGNVDIINGLNHYIGMKTLHAEDFSEFRVLPYCIVFYALLFLAAAAAGKRNFLNITFTLFLLFGIVAMADFWKWEYDYGHNLNPDAAIKVPGMSYQPPLIGYKQLLNFSAYSMPDTGGWIFAGVGIIALLCVILAWKQNRNFKINAMRAAITSVILFTLSSCNIEPQPLKIGTDNCTFCKMTLTDSRFGGEIVTKKGKVSRFDDMHCILAYLQKEISQKDIGAVYITNFSGDHSLIDVNKAFFMKSAALQSPMAGNVAAFRDKGSMQQIMQQLNGTEVSWNELNKK